MTEREPWRRDPPADPTGIDEPHDVLAADEFGIGTRDERLPPDPSRFDPPHDILAAEEFAMPVAESTMITRDVTARTRVTLITLILIAALVAFLAVRRRS